MLTTLLCIGGYCVALCGSVAAGATLKAAQNHWSRHCPACEHHTQVEREARQRMDAIVQAVERAAVEAFEEAEG